MSQPIYAIISNMKTPEKFTTPESIDFIPEVTFEIANPDSEAELFYSFIKEGRRDRWLGVFNRIYPELVNELAYIKNREEGIVICKNFTERTHESNKEKIQSAKVLFEVEWKKIETNFLRTLSDHFETTWPEDKQKITGAVTVLPVFPRFLDKYSFYVGHKDISKMIETSAHEIVHFLWFKKWKEVFPECKRSEYESPHLAWRLSEIIDPIILQCQPQIKELIKPTSWGYSSFKEIKIGDLSMTDYFKKIYL